MVARKRMSLTLLFGKNMRNAISIDGASSFASRAGVSLNPNFSRLGVPGFYRKFVTDQVGLKTTATTCLTQIDARTSACRRGCASAASSASHDFLTITTRLNYSIPPIHPVPRGFSSPKSSSSLRSTPCSGSSARNVRIARGTRSSHDLSQESTIAVLGDSCALVSRRRFPAFTGKQQNTASLTTTQPIAIVELGILTNNLPLPTSSSKMADDAWGAPPALQNPDFWLEQASSSSTSAGTRQPEKRKRQLKNSTSGEWHSSPSSAWGQAVASGAGSSSERPRRHHDHQRGAEVVQQLSPYAKRGIIDGHERNHARDMDAVSDYLRHDDDGYPYLPERKQRRNHGPAKWSSSDNRETPWAKSAEGGHAWDNDYKNYKSWSSSSSKSSDKLASSGSNYEKYMKDNADGNYHGNKPHQQNNVSGGDTTTSSCRTKGVSGRSGTGESSRKRAHVLSVDIDGTIADITNRIEIALKEGDERSSAYWATLLDGQHYHMDEPIVWSRTFLRAWVGLLPWASCKNDSSMNQEAGGDDQVVENVEQMSITDSAVAAPDDASSKSSTDRIRKIIYVSGRRAGTEEQTREWLEAHGFPLAEIRHRPQGIGSWRWKKETLIELRKNSKLGKIVAHLGDREDDVTAAQAAGVRGVYVEPNLWLTKREAEENGVADLITVHRNDDEQKDHA
ncbi:unnamed protein product [Amoebophrya sp. A25]|nr:unnamed protein product [Amoebophrya sp. A25]|eukprot:GSA25T00005896001.1